MFHVLPGLCVVGNAKTQKLLCAGTLDTLTNHLVSYLGRLLPCHLPILHMLTQPCDAGSTDLGHGCARLIKRASILIISELDLFTQTSSTRIGTITQ